MVVCTKCHSGAQRVWIAINLSRFCLHKTMAEEDSKLDQSPEFVGMEDEGDEWRNDGVAEEEGESHGGCAAADASVAGMITSTLICMICGKNARMKNQIFCAVPCAADVKAGQRDAKSQGKEALEAWKKVRRQGGSAFAGAIQAYKSKCAGFGRGFRRPAFAWVRYWMAIEFASRVQTGTKSLWLTKGAYCNMKKIDEEMTAEEAALAWARELESLPASRIAPDRKKILVPIESFVVQLNERSQIEQTQYGIKEQKNPCSADIQERVGWMGKDHTSFNNNEQWGKSVGLEDGVLSSLGGEGTFATSSAIQEEKLKVAEEAEQEEKKKAERKAKADAKRAAKPFDQGRTTTLGPEFEALGTNLQKKSEEALKSSQDLLDQVAASKHVDLFKSASLLLVFRRSALVAAHGDPSKTATENKELFEEYKQEKAVAEAVEKGESPVSCLMTMQCLGEFKDSLRNFSVGSEDELKALRTSFKTTRLEFESLISRVKDQQTRLKTSFNRKIDSDTKAAEKDPFYISSRTCIDA